jgi:thiol-disulfide isomerase/thioredoxin
VSRRLVAFVAAGLWLAPLCSALAAPAPAAGMARLAEISTPLPMPYDPSVAAAAQVDQARARARASGKLLLIDFGGNWCADCRILAAVMRLPAIAAFVEAHYEVVMVDVGRMDRNLAIPARWGVRRLEGVPAVLVIDGKDRLVDAGHVEALADARTMTPQALADWLARWTD